jgi:hypothetical protein
MKRITLFPAALALLLFLSVPVTYGSAITAAVATHAFDSSERFPPQDHTALSDGPQSAALDAYTVSGGSGSFASAIAYVTADYGVSAGSITIERHVIGNLAPAELRASGSTLAVYTDTAHFNQGVFSIHVDPVLCYIDRDPLTVALDAHYGCTASTSFGDYFTLGLGEGMPAFTLTVPEQGLTVPMKGAVSAALGF